MKSTKHRSKHFQFFRVIISIVAWLLFIISALFVLGTFLPSVPYLGAASVIMPAFPLWFLVLPLISGALIWFMTKSVRVKMFAAAIAFLSIIATFFISVRMVQAFKAHGAEVSIFSSAGLGADPVKADTLIQFGSFDGQPLYTDIYRPSGNATLSPIIVNIHGVHEYMVIERKPQPTKDGSPQNGWLVFSIDYTLSTDKKHYWNDVHNQIACFLTWMAAHTKDYGGDTSKLTLMGTSAGGNLALNVGAMSAQNLLTSTCGGISPQAGAVVGLVPGVDPEDIVKNKYPGTGGVVTDVYNYPGGTPQQYPERYKAIKSSTYLSPKNPPTLIFLALNDHLVNYHSIDEYAAQATRAGARIELVRVPYADHPTFGIPGSIANKGYRQVTFDWLTKLGLAPTPK